MNKKLLTITIALMIFALVVAPAAATLPATNPLPSGKPYELIWTFFQDLQNQITNIQLIPGPQGPTGATGAQGPAGPQGEPGPQGDLGPAGTCTNCLCPTGQFVTGFDSTGSLVCTGLNLPSILPLCKAGTPFDSLKYPQNTPQSDPMVFTATWDGNGRVYISGEATSLTGIWADDGYIITIQPSGATFDAPEHWGHQHPVVELTSGMTPGSNTFTLIIKNWVGLSMSYGSISGFGVDQTPYIIEVNAPANAMTATKVSTTTLPSFITETGDGLIVNGTLIKA